ncbi:unnamed protein product [Pleuronectes platessa]|uniref:Uncharacterized protein n=1 Tax=Pleuronectes platessa TaxID=8262 RepID=A0A9N7TGH2_PLEPL|nr:unnamed protein product [Pleuronectes platessa]
MQCSPDTLIPNNLFDSVEVPKPVGIGGDSSEFMVKAVILEPKEHVNQQWRICSTCNTMRIRKPYCTHANMQMVHLTLSSQHFLRQISRQQDPLLANVTPLQTYPLLHLITGSAPCTLSSCSCSCSCFCCCDCTTTATAAAPILLMLLLSKVKMFHQLRHLSLTYILLCTLPARANHPQPGEMDQNLLLRRSPESNPGIDHMVTIYHTSTRPTTASPSSPHPGLLPPPQSVTRPTTAAPSSPHLWLYLLLQSVTAPTNSRHLIPTLWLIPPLQSVTRPHHTPHPLPHTLALYLSSNRDRPTTAAPSSPTLALYLSPPIGDRPQPQRRTLTHTSGFITTPPIGYPPHHSPPPPYTFGFIFLPPFAPSTPPWTPLSAPPSKEESIDKGNTGQVAAISAALSTLDLVQDLDPGLTLFPVDPAPFTPPMRSYPRPPYSRHNGRSYRRSRSSPTHPYGFLLPSGPDPGRERMDQIPQVPVSLPWWLPEPQPWWTEATPRGRPPYELKGPSPEAMIAGREKVSTMGKGVQPTVQNCKDSRHHIPHYIPEVAQAARQ